MIGKTLWKAMAVLVILSMATPFVQAAPLNVEQEAFTIEAPEPERAEQPSPLPEPQETPPLPPGIRVETTTDEAINLIEPELRELALAGGPELVKVTVLVAPGADLGRYFERHLVLTGGEFDRVVGLTPADNLLKLATVDGTLAVLNMETRQAPEPPRPFMELEGEEAPACIQRTLSSGKQPAALAAPAGDNGISSFFTEDTNGVRATWGLGVTGDGDVISDHLKLAVVDTGVDFANPDLRGIQARIQSPTSAFFDGALGFGWPIAFDDRSMSDYALDIRDSRNNWAWYMNAYEIVDDDPTTDPFLFDVYDPALGETRTYTIGTDIQNLVGALGTYRFGWHPDDSLLSAWDALGAPYESGSNIGVLVFGYAYGPAWGPYNTVAVDMWPDRTFDFSDGADGGALLPSGAPAGFAQLGNEVVCINMGWSTAGNCDLSGGMVYYMAGMSTPMPASDWLYGMGPAPVDEDYLVAFMLNDITENGGDHGTLCAGTAVGQGNITQMPYAGTYGDVYWPPAWYNPGVEGGISQGPGIETALVAIGNYYAGGSSLNSYDFVALGYDGIPAGDVGDNDDQPHIYTNSYGSGSVENDGWDLSSRYVTLINYGHVAQQGMDLPGDGDYSPLFVGSTGNSGFGYGTVTSPQPESAVMAGVSTVFGQFNLGDTALQRDWVNWGHLGGFSDRGPTSMSTLGVHVLANGFFGSGNEPLNYRYGGDRSVNFWSGTSRSGPEVGGILALIYDAYYQANGFYPTWYEARSLLMNGARTTYNDPKAQGAGMANALNAVEIILGNRGAWVVNSEDDGYWIPGDYRGVEYSGFARGLFSGESDTETFTAVNASTTDTITVGLEPVTLEVYDHREWNFTTLDLATEGGRGYYSRRLYGPTGSNPGYGAADPIYISTDPTDTQLLQDADLMVLRLSWPYEQFEDNPAANWFFIYAFAWRDVDVADGSWFTDTNGNGYINSGEYQDEWVRISYDYHGNTAEIRIREPWALMNGEVGPNEPPMATMDDILIALRHFYYGGYDTTDLQVTVELYEEVEWGELELETNELVIPPDSAETFDVTAYTTIRGTTLFTENFDSAVPPALPTGWDQVDVSGTTGDWATHIGTAHPSGHSAHSAPNLAHFNSYSAPIGNSTRLYQTAGLDLSAVPGAALSFWMYHDSIYGNDDYVQVQVSTDGGVNWDDVGAAVMRYLGSGIDEWRQHEVDLSAYVGPGMTDVRIGFLAVSAYGNDCHIDDVKVYQAIIEPPGEYNGYLKLTYTEPYTYYEYLPVEKQIWFPSEIDPVLGGVDQPWLYDNGMMFGATGPSSSGQRAESGDWRFFYTDVEDEPDPGTYMLAHTTWVGEDDAPNDTDIDTLFYSPVAHDSLFTGFDWLFGPTGLAVKGGSMRSGSAPDWEYYTTSGGPDDWSSIPLEDEGLYAVAAHVVRWGGEQTEVPYTITVGTVQATPEVYMNGLTCYCCTVPITFKTNHADLEGMALAAVGYGFNQPVHLTPSVNQGETYVYTYTITADDAYKLQVNTANPDPSVDIDLEVYYNGQLVGSSGRSDSNEQVLLTYPPAGDYLIEVYGYSVPGGATTFDLDIVEVSGEGAMTVSDLPTAITLGDTYTMYLHFEDGPAYGSWQGALFLGPEDSPLAVEIPIYLDQGEAEKSAWQETVLPGELVTYTIVLTESPSVTLWELEDVIPDGFEFVSVEGASYISDTGGVTVTWSNETCVAEWLDASGGDALGLLDDGEADVTMPFALDFYDVTSDTMTVGNNGGILFGMHGGNLYATNHDLGSISAPDYLIAPFWDDMDDETGDVYTETFGTAPNRQFVVEWHDRPHHNGVGDGTFEVILDEASDDIWFLYQDVDFGHASYNYGAAATIGVHSTDADGYYTQHSHDTASVWDNWAIQLERISPTTYTIAYAGPICHADSFGSHTITLTLRALEPGYRTNTAYVTTGPNVCPIEDTVLVAGAIPNWEKVILINEEPYGPGESPFTVVPSDTVTIVDHVSVTSTEPITYALLEEWTESLDFITYTVDFGAVSVGAGYLEWSVSGGVPDVEYTITKTFHVNGEHGWTNYLTETLTVGGGPAPIVIPLEFNIPATIAKAGPDEAYTGDVISYTIVIETAESIAGTAIMTDALPAGIEFAGALTTTHGYVDYDAGDDAVYWSNQPLMLLATMAPVSTGESRQVELTLEAVDASPSAASATAPMVPDAAVSLVLDDGSIETNYGVNGGGFASQFIWLNNFTPDPAEYPFELEEIWVMFSSGVGVSVGDAIDLVVYEDADGNPANGATWLATFNETVQAADGATWNVFTLASPVPLDGPGNVIIAVINRWVNSGVTPEGWPAAFDTTASQGRSWLGWYAADPPDPAALPPDTFYHMEDIGPGNWLVRGYGETIDIPSVITITFDVTVTASFCNNITNTAELNYNGTLLSADHIFHVACVEVSGADFTYTPTDPEAGETLTFTGTVATGEEPIAWEWDFGDGEFGSGRIVTHTFAISDTYTVVMTATNCAGTGVATATDDVAVTGETDITVDPLALDAVLNPGGTTTRTLTIGNVGTADLTWNLAESPAVTWLNEAPAGGTVAPAGSTPVVVTFDATGLSDGIYTTTLQVTSDDPDEPQVDVSVALTVTTTCIDVSGADFIFAPVAPQVGETVTFTGTVTAGTPPITYTWNFGDGSAPRVGTPITHIFPLTVTAQTYTVTMTASNACPSEQVVEKVVTVVPRYIYLPLVMRNYP